MENTLTDVTPGDISMALPHRIVMDIIEGLEILNQIIPGVNADSTLVLAPEIKFYARKIEVDGSFQEFSEEAICGQETALVYQGG